jgi:hypothetical protein
MEPMPSRLRCSRPPSHGVLDASEDGVPARSKSASHLRPRQHARPARDEPHERVGRVRLARRPRHHLDGDAAAPAVDSAHGIHEEHRDPPERHEGEVPRRTRYVVAGSLPAAARTDGPRAAARSKVNMKSGLSTRPRPGDLAIDEAGLRVQPAQDIFEVHRVRGCWCRSLDFLARCIFLLQQPRPALGAKLAGGTPVTLPRCEPRDERRAGRFSSLHAH